MGESGYAEKRQGKGGMTERAKILDFMRQNPGVKCKWHTRPAIRVYAFWDDNAGPFNPALDEKLNGLNRLVPNVRVMQYPFDAAVGEEITV